MKRASIFLCRWKSRSTNGGVGDVTYLSPFWERATKIAPPGDIFHQPFGEMSRIQGNLADHVDDDAVLSPEKAILVTTPGMESSYP